MTKCKKVFSNPFFILILAVYSTWILQACHNKINKKSKYYNNSFGEEKEKAIGQLSILSKKINNTYLDSTVLLENFMSGQQNSIRQLVKKGDKLIFQYSELNCDVCVDSALIHFKEFALKHDKRRSMIIAASSNRRYMANFIRENKLRNLDVYLVNIVDFRRLYAYDLGMPFIYTTNNSLQISNAFVPAKEFPDISQVYYSGVVNKLFVK